MPSSRPHRRFSEIIDNCERIQRYTTGMTLESFRTDDMTIDAVERCLQRITQAASKLGSVAEALAPDQPWRQIRGLGNALRHDYDRLDVVGLWQIVTVDLPSLEAACQVALDRLKSSKPPT